MDVTRRQALTIGWGCVAWSALTSWEGAAQTLTRRVYLMPLIGTGAARTDARAPKYGATHLANAWHGWPYGTEPVILVASAVDTTQHSLLAGEADVVVLPADLDTTVSGAVATVQGLLHALNIPADWVTTGTTYRQILRVVGTVFFFTQRYARFETGRLFTAGRTLSTTFAALPLGMRQALQDTAGDLQLDTSAMTGGTTLRQILKAVADQITVRLWLGGLDA